MKDPGDSFFLKTFYILYAIRRCLAVSTDSMLPSFVSWTICSTASTTTSCWSQKHGPGETCLDTELDLVQYPSSPLEDGPTCLANLKWISFGLNMLLFHSSQFYFFMLGLETQWRFRQIWNCVAPQHSAPPNTSLDCSKCAEVSMPRCFNIKWPVRRSLFDNSTYATRSDTLPGASGLPEKPRIVLSGD